MHLGQGSNAVRGWGGLNHGKRKSFRFVHDPQYNGQNLGVRPVDSSGLLSLVHQNDHVLETVHFLTKISPEIGSPKSRLVGEISNRADGPVIFPIVFP